MVRAGGPARQARASPIVRDERHHRIM